MATDFQKLVLGALNVILAKVSTDQQEDIEYYQDWVKRVDEYLNNSSSIWDV